MTTPDTTGLREAEALAEVFDRLAVPEFIREALTTGLLASREVAEVRRDTWPCANYTAPVTCLTAPSSESGRCGHCGAQAAEVRRDTAERIAQAIEALPLIVSCPDPIYGGWHNYPRAAEQVRVDAARIAREEVSRG